MSKSVSTKTDATTAKDILDESKRLKDATAGEKSFGDVYDDASGEVFPDAERMPFSQLKDLTVRFLDAQIRKVQSDYGGERDMAVMLVENIEGTIQNSVACSGVVVVKKMRWAIENKQLPLLGTVTRRKYWNIE